MSDLISCRAHFNQFGNDGSAFAQECINNFPSEFGSEGPSLPSSGTITEEEYQKGNFDLGGFFGDLAGLVPGTLQGIGALRASQNPNLTSYAPSTTGDVTNVYQSGSRSNNPLNTTDTNRTTLIIGVIVGLIAVGALIYFVTKKS